MVLAGATLGSGFGGAAALIMDPFHIPVAAPQAYALVGVAAMLAANCQVPLTSVLLLFELTHDYFIILPTLAAVGISYWVASLPAASSAFTPSTFQKSDQSSGSSAAGFVDALPNSSQLGLGVTGEVELPETQGAGPDSSLSQAASNGRADVVSIGSNGSKQTVAIDPAYRDGISDSFDKSPVLESMDTSPDTLEGVSIACALEEACVLLTVDTSMTEALTVLDEVGQKVALVTNMDGAVVGVLTRESIVKQLAKGPNATIQPVAE